MTGLRLTRTQSTPSDRGRLMTAREVAQDIFRGAVSPEWVRRNVPGKIVLGHSRVMWYEHDVRDWIESRKEGGS